MKETSTDEQTKRNGKRRTSIQQAISKQTSALDPNIVYTLLLGNKKVQTCADTTYYGTEKDAFIVTIKIKRSGECSSVDLGEFDEIVWSKCSKDASENADIVKVRNDADRLREEAYELIEEIMRH